MCVYDGLNQKQQKKKLIHSQEQKGGRTIKEDFEYFIGVDNLNRLCCVDGVYYHRCLGIIYGKYYCKTPDVISEQHKQKGPKHVDITFNNFFSVLADQVFLVIWSLTQALA